MPQIVIERGNEKGRILQVQEGETYVFGRDPKRATVPLSDVLCSRAHFQIQSEGDRWFVEDLQSANGTLLNSKRVTRARLNYGDRIEAGNTLLSFLSAKEGRKQGGLIGQTIAGHRILERVGRGGMGTVYKALQLSLDRVVAFKVLAPEMVKDQAFVEQFRVEARSAAKLTHPNILAVYDVGEDQGVHYISMEYAGAGSLEDRIKAAGALSVEEALPFMIGAARALLYAEKNHIVHRDIKPDNLMLTDEGQVKLGDLGLAKNLKESGVQEEGVFGTPYFIAPEQALGKPIDHRADLYALGGTFYKMLTGRPPHEGQNVHEILRKQIKEEPAPVQELAPEVPDALAATVHRMLAKHPDRRFASSTDLIAELEALQRALGGEGDARPTPAAGLPRPRLLIAGAAGAAVLVVTVLAVVLSGGEQPTGPEAAAADTPAPPAPPVRVEVPAPALPPTVDPEQLAAQFRADQAANERQETERVREANMEWNRLRRLAPSAEVLARLEEFLHKYGDTRSPAVQGAQARIDQIRAFLALEARAQGEFDAAVQKAGPLVARGDFGAADRRWQEFLSAHQANMDLDLLVKKAQLERGKVREAADAAWRRKDEQARALIARADSTKDEKPLDEARAVYQEVEDGFGIADFIGLARKAKYEVEQVRARLRRDRVAAARVQWEADLQTLERIMAETEAAVLQFRFAEVAQQLTAATERLQTQEAKQRLYEKRQDMYKAQAIFEKLVQGVQQQVREKAGQGGFSYETRCSTFLRRGETVKEVRVEKADAERLYVAVGAAQVAARWRDLPVSDLHALARGALALDQSRVFGDQLNAGVLFAELEGFDEALTCFRRAEQLADRDELRKNVRERVALTLLLGALKDYEQQRRAEGDVKLDLFRREYQDTQAAQEARGQ